MIYNSVRNNLATIRFLAFEHTLVVGLYANIYLYLDNQNNPIMLSDKKLPLEKARYNCSVYLQSYHL